MNKKITHIEVVFHATAETAREVHFAPQHSYHVQIPWDHPRCTTAMREWSALYGTTRTVAWPLHVTGEPTVEDAITLLEPFAVEALNARKTYINLVMDAIGRIIRSGVDALEINEKNNSVYTPRIDINRSYEPFGVLPEWTWITDALGNAEIGASYRDAWDALRKEAQEALRERIVAREARDEAERARQDAEKTRVAAAQRGELEAAMVGVLNDEVDLQRWQDGTMPELEARGILRDSIFEAIECEDDQRYKRMRGVDIYPDDPDRVELDAGEHDGPLSRAAWLKVRSWRERCADGPWTVRVRRHEAEWTDEDGEDQTVVKLSAMVSYRVGPWTLSREYALDD